MGRYRRTFVVVSMVLLMLYYVTPLLWQGGQAWVQRYKTGGMQQSSGSVSSSIVYPVKPGEWLTFNIPEGSQHLRIISNAHIRKPDNITLQDNWKYILRYQLVDGGGKVIMDELYHHRSWLTSYRDEQGGVFFGNFYSGHALTPLDGRLILLSMMAIQQAVSVRISFIRQSREVEETALRLYVPAKISEHRLAAVWLRMSNKDKEILAKPSVYPPSLLSETEKTNLLKHQWQPVGPVGVEGKDYIFRTLYVHKELEQERLDALMIAAGLQLGADHPGIIAIPEQGGELRIQVKALDGSPLSSPVPLQLNWFGRGREQRWQRQAQWIPGSEELSFPVGGGLLQIKAPELVLVHAVLHTADQQQIEITPKPLMITGYLASHGVDYQVLHVNNQSAALRIDIRQIYDQNAVFSETAVAYQWFNRQQQVVNSGLLPVKSTPSIYDRLSGEQKDLEVSDPVIYYLNVPADVSRLRLDTDRNDLMVNVYSQPYQYQKMSRVPENSYVSLGKKDWYPAWFLLRPGNEKALIKQQAVRKVAAQYRPPEDDPALLANRYIWEDYRPLEQTEARFILTERTALDYRDEALASVYCRLSPNQLRRIKLKTYGDLPHVSPQLIYIRPRKSAFNVAVHVDRKLSLNRSAIGQQGAFRLSELDRGEHSVKVTTQGGGQWLMNHVSACPSQTFLKRRVFKLENRQLTFLYTNEQSENQILSGRFYAAEFNNERSVIQVTIEPLQNLPPRKVQENWTFTRRGYDIRPPQGVRSIVLYSHGHYLNSGESFFIPFNRDLPKGEYRIKMMLKKGASGYLTLSQIKPGFHEQRRFYRETNHRID